MTHLSFNSGPLATMVLVLISLLSAGATLAQDCNWARQKHAEYRASCQSIDGCRSLAESEEFVALSCGGSRSGSKPAMPPTPKPPAPVAKPAPQQPSSPTNPQDEQCQGLTNAIRGLSARWQQAVAAKARAYQEGIDDLRAMRRALENDAKWQAGTFRELSGYLAKTTQISADLIGNLLAFDPLTGTARTILKRIPLTSEQILGAINAGKTIYAITDEELEKVYFDVLVGMVADRNLIANGFRTVRDLADGLSEMAEMPRNVAELRSEFRARLKSIDDQIASLQRKINQSKGYQEYEAKLRQALQKRCSQGQPQMNRLP
jgi:hypothetical protein